MFGAEIPYAYKPKPTNLPNMKISKSSDQVSGNNKLGALFRLGGSFSGLFDLRPPLRCSSSFLPSVACLGAMIGIAIGTIQFPTENTAYWSSFLVNTESPLSGDDKAYKITWGKSTDYRIMTQCPNFRRQLAYLAISSKHSDI